MRGGSRRFWKAPGQESWTDAMTTRNRRNPWIYPEDRHEIRWASFRSLPPRFTSASRSWGEDCVFDGNGRSKATMVTDLKRLKNRRTQHVQSEDRSLGVFGLHLQPCAPAPNRRPAIPLYAWTRCRASDVISRVRSESTLRGIDPQS